MTKKEILDKLAQEKLLCLYTVNDMDLLDQAEEALSESGLSFIELTYRSEYASPAIKKLSESGKLIVGAGTVRDLATCKEAVENGAKFIVSPGLNKEIVLYCNDMGIPVFPGAVTPSEIMEAMDLDLNTVKFFPADVYGGLAAIKALSGPFYDLRFVPTGGVNKDNFTDFLAYDSILAVGGSFILTESMLKEKGLEACKDHLKELKAKV